MTTIEYAANDFLSQKRIAVAGVSRRDVGHGANSVYRRLRARGYQVFPINPDAAVVEGDPCYRHLRSIPGGVDAVVIGTTPVVAESIVRECGEVGVKRVWMHRGFGEGSVSTSATEYCRSNGISVIPGGCPLMFAPTSDLTHRAMCWLLKLRGAIPKEV